MKEDILDRSGSYLRLFTSPIIIDKTLPKWSVIKEKALDKPEILDNKNLTNNVNEYITFGEFSNMKSKDFNIYIGKKVAENIFGKNNYSLDYFLDDESVPSNKDKFHVRLIKRLYRKYVNRRIYEMEAKKHSEEYEIDILKFFEEVKLTSKQSQKTYIERIEPYMVAIKKAQKMGQQALVDKLTEELFNNKYESILFSEGFHYKITEEQIVNFVKKTEKGVRLSYITNYIRPIPDNVIELKEKADKLMVFDNYAVLYYDPELKSYKMTKAEEERLRQKKSDPILFGLIHGSKNLYYISDWVDEWCDLTLDEFIKVSGIEKEKLKIDDKIKLK